MNNRIFVVVSIDRCCVRTVARVCVCRSAVCVSCVLYGYRQNMSCCVRFHSIQPTIYHISFINTHTHSDIKYVPDGTPCTGVSSAFSPKCDRGVCRSSLTSGSNILCSATLPCPVVNCEKGTCTGGTCVYTPFTGPELANGVVCREKVSECDIEEICFESPGTCPPDKVAPAGT